jgi:cyclopropane-fatty-acyl-phospholipid synthase
MATTEGMKRGGYYDDHSEYQRSVAESGAALVDDCVAAVPLPEPPTTFVVADYGASTGRNSIASATRAVGAVRKRHATQAVAVVHNDLPTNDWDELFHNLAASPDSYLALDGPAVLPMVSAISFFEAAAPARSVHVGLSFSAAHWLREQPTVTVPEGFYFCEATGAARAQLAAEADADWTRFLTSRAADLAAGGRLLVQMVGTEPDPGGGLPHVTAQRLLRAMAEVGAAMAKDGLLDPLAVDRYVLGVYARTPDEARAPLDRPDSPVHGAFDVVVCRTDPVANPYLEQWRTDGDAAKYAASATAFVRGFTESSLKDHLFTPGSRGESVDALADDFFGRLQRRFAADPEHDRFEDWTLTVVLTRRA